MFEDVALCTSCESEPTDAPDMTQWIESRDQSVEEVRQLLEKQSAKWLADHNVRRKVSEYVLMN